MKLFRYYFINKDGKYLTVIDGVVTAVDAETELSNAPTDWGDYALGWERDLKSCGLALLYSEPAGFVLDCAKILRSIIYGESFEETITLVIKKRKTVVDLIAHTFQHQYLEEYTGLIDLSSIQDELDKVSVKVTAHGVEQLYNAYKDTVYEFPLSDGDAFVKNDGMVLHATAKFLIPAVLNITQTIPIYYQDRDGNAPFIAGLDQDTSSATDQYFLKNTGTTPLDVTLKGSISYTPNASTSEAKLRLWRVTGGTTYTVINEDDFNPASTTLRKVDYDEVITLGAGEALYFSITAVGSGAAVQFSESYFTASYQSRFTTTTLQGFTPLALFKKLVAAITGDEANGQSDFLATIDDYVITSGDGIRGITDAKVKTSLSDFLEAFHTIEAIGWGIEEEKITVEPKDHFLNTDNVVDLGSIKNLVVTKATDLLFNTIKIGYPVVDTEDVNGRSAFNNSHLYKTVVKSITKELTIVSPYYTDPYAIELVRQNFSGKVSTDSTSDNRNFILHTKKVSFEVTATFFTFGGFNFIGLTGVTDANYFPQGSKITFTGTASNDQTFTIETAGEQSGGVLLAVTEAVTPESGVDAILNTNTRILNRDIVVTAGVPDPDTVFNVIFSPKRCLLKHMPWINGCLDGLAGSMLTFQTTEKNADLVAGDITEKDDVEVGTEQLFKSTEFSFDGPVPENLKEMLDALPSTCFQFTWLNKTYKGFTRRTGIAPASEKEQAIKLLASPDTDLTKLIR